MFKTLFAFGYNCTEDMRELAGFFYQFFSLLLEFFISAGVYQSKPIPAFFCFFSAYLDSHSKIFLA